MSRRSRHDERAEEMRAHIDLYVDELISRGRSREDAEREARVRFGNPRARLEEIDQMSKLAVFDAVMRDVRYAVRMMRRSPGFSLTVVLTLALVIGANTAVFSLADAILFRPLPFPAPERLSFVAADLNTTERGAHEQLNHDTPTWEAVKDATALDTAVYSTSTNGVNLVVGDRAVFAEQQRVGAGYFRVLGVVPAMGREFRADEDVPGGPAIAVISYRLWNSELEADPEIVSKTIRLRGEPYQVVGVMPEAFDGVTDADVWTPLRAARNGEGNGTNFYIVGRLAADVTWADARQELRSLGIEPLNYRGVHREEGEDGWLTARPMQEVEAEANRAPIAMLGAATAAVLLIACVNIAALLMGRGKTRSKELATRMALGSGRRAVIRQLMVESLVLGLVGGAVGLFVAWVGLAGLQSIGASTFAVWGKAALNGRVLLVTGGLAIVTSVVFGLVPAFQASRLDPQHALTDSGSRSVAGGASRLPGQVLVVSEVALGVALLIVTGLLVRTFVNLNSVDAGFDADGLVTASVSLQDARYQDAGAVNLLVAESLRQLREMPVVESAAVSLQLPYTRLLNLGFAFTDAADAEGHLANLVYVSDEFFETYGIPVREGRALSALDRSGSPPVVVVNETFVRAFSSDRPVLGRRLGTANEEREVVGVVGDVQQANSGILFEGRVNGPIMTTPTIYLPVTQSSGPFLNVVHQWFRPVWTVRVRNGAQAGGAIATAITNVDPLLPVSAETGLEQTMMRATSVERLMTTLVAVLAGVALFLAALGIHGLIAHAVNERTREIAIRIAVGAPRASTIGRVALSGLGLAAAGTLAGAVLSVWGTRLVQGFLWGVGEYDVATYAGVAAFFLLVAGIASVVPALRILRLDPAAILRG